MDGYVVEMARTDVPHGSGRYRWEALPDSFRPCSQGSIPRIEAYLYCFTPGSYCFYFADYDFSWGTAVVVTGGFAASCEPPYYTEGGCAIGPVGMNCVDGRPSGVPEQLLCQPFYLSMRNIPINIGISGCTRTGVIIFE